MKPEKTDFLVLGSGIAGLIFALKAACHGRVILLTKKRDSVSNTNHAQGGVASALAGNDSPLLHSQDTLRAGAGLCDEEAVDILVREGPSAIDDLIRYGVRFTRKTDMKAGRTLDLGREGGHSVNRIVHAKDLTGREIERALLRRARRHPRIAIRENHIGIDLITEHNLKKHPRDRGIHCYGVYALDEETNKVRPFLSKITVLATGGTGQVYQFTTNPEIATGDGIAMAYRAGAAVANLEFMQFHPTTLYDPEGKKAFLISEAVRGYGAELRALDGRLLMKGKHPMGSLAPRDIVARAIDEEMKRRGAPYVHLDVTAKDPRITRHKFPNIFRNCLKAGLDITRKMIPVVPAAHYMCGGVLVDADGRTTIQRLYACGETACTGVHGANRLASNSLLEAVVFANRACRAACAERATALLPARVPAWDDSGTTDMSEWVVLAHDRNEIRQLMWDYVGIVRSNHRLRWALRRIQLIAKEIEEFYRRTKVRPEVVELRNIATVAKLIVLCALKRKESRGLHCNTDYPRRNDRHWKRNTLLRGK